MDSSYVYILASQCRGTLYIGSTTDLIKRIFEHKNKFVPGFTEKYNVTNLVYFEEHSTIMEAGQREKQLKKWARQWKLDLIETNNPHWKDLYDALIQ